MANEAPQQLFDAKAFMESEGLTFKGLARPGVALVETPDGQESEFDVSGFLASEGVSNAQIEYNTPDSALEQSPVDLIDRFKMSFGNTKGNAAYLKNKFEGVTVMDGGELAVKDAGVWKKVDPSGFGDKDGWQVSEMLGDLADLGGIGVDVAGQVAGGAAGAAIAPGVGAIAGASAGAGAATAVNAVLGRVMGTYEATPEELVKEVGLNTAMGALGEVVGLGAKHMVMPAIRNFIQKGGMLTDGSKRVMSNMLQSTTGVESRVWDDAFNNPAEYKAIMESIEAAAQNPVSLIDDVVPGAASSVAAGSNEAMDMAARRSMHGPVRALAEEAPERLSAQWRGKRSSLVANTPDDVVIDATKPVSETLSLIQMNLQKSGLLNEEALINGKFVFKKSKEIASRLAIKTEEADLFTSSVKDYLSAMSHVLREETPKTGKPAMNALLDVIKKSDDAYYNIVDGNPAIQNIFAGATAELRAALINTAPQKMLNNESGVFAINNLNKWYSTLKPAAQKAKQAVEKGTQGIDSLIDMYDRPAARSLTGAQVFESLATLAASPEAGQAALSRIRVTNGARKIMSTAPRGLGGGGLVRQAAGALGMTPRAAYRMAQPVITPIQMAGKALETLDPVTRNKVLNDPEKLGALFSVGLQGLVQQ